MPATRIRPFALISLIIPLTFTGSPMAAQSDESASWAAIMNSQSAGDYRAFLEAFPRGDFAGEARRKYSTLAHAKIPPRVQQLELHYPPEARASGAAMRALRYVILDVDVTADGKAGAIKFTRRSGVDVMDQEASSAARRATYLPALDNGAAVEEHMSLTLRFGMRCSAAAEGILECNNFNNARGLGRP